MITFFLAYKLAPTEFLHPRTPSPVKAGECMYACMYTCINVYIKE